MGRVFSRQNSPALLPPSQAKVAPSAPDVPSREKYVHVRDRKVLKVLRPRHGTARGHGALREGGKKAPGPGVFALYRSISSSGLQKHSAIHRRTFSCPERRRTQEAGIPFPLVFSTLFAGPLLLHSDGVSLDTVSILCLFTCCFPPLSPSESALSIVLGRWPSAVTHLRPVCAALGLHCRPSPSRLTVGSRALCSGYPTLSGVVAALSCHRSLYTAMSSLKRKAGGGAQPDPKKPKQNGSITSFFGAPKSSAKANGGASDSSSPVFNKSKWVAGLTPEQKDLLQLEIDTLHESWLAHLKDDLTSREFLDLKRFLDRETTAGKKWFPPKEDVYSWCVVPETCARVHFPVQVPARRP